MPECKFGLNDRVIMGGGESGRPRSGSSVELDDVQFHQCVKLSNFDQNRTITFIPPDGEFELMRYRTTNDINLPFKVNAVVDEISGNLVDYTVSVKALFNSKFHSQNVVIRVPTPPNTSSTKIVVTAGKAKYVGSENAIVWK
ncbi:hypothetical protein HK405_000393 [Cladochytrium tenue]|nr:hypothetical protein HK405_000393 [Cladochytrium tenue]